MDFRFAIDPFELHDGLEIGILSKRTSKAARPTSGTQSYDLSTCHFAYHHPVRARRIILTIGYEGATIESFLETVASAGITEVIDVRQFPISRKRGFSKKALASALETVGASYRHLVGLGSPKTIRDELRQRGDWPAFARQYLQHLRAAQADLTEIANRSSSGKAAILCFEADFHVCHRSIIANELLEQHLVDEVVHLRPSEGHETFRRADAAD